MLTYAKTNVISDLKTDRIDGIIHICNCFNIMREGVGKKLSTLYPVVAEADSLTKAGDVAKLGTYELIEVSKNKYVINAYAQFNCGKEFLVVSNALHKIAFEMSSDLKLKGLRLGFVKSPSKYKSIEWETTAIILEKYIPDLKIYIINT